MWRAVGFAKHLGAHNPEPYFDEIEPRAVIRGEVNDDPLFRRPKPLAALLWCMEIALGRTDDAAELGHQLTKREGVVGGEIVHDVMQWLVFRASRHMPPEERQEGWGLMIGMAFAKNLAVGKLKECEEVQGPIADVFEFFQALAHGIGSQVRCQSLENLNAGALIEEKEIGRRMMVEMQ